MWQLDNRTPYAAERGWTRGRDGGEIWLTVVKCTFDVLPDGSTRLADPQLPVLIAPEFTQVTGSSGLILRRDGEIVRTKRTTDVLVSGHAHAPNGRAVTHLDVAMEVGPIRKRLRVTGDRRWHRGEASSPQPFTMMPLTYERSYGGFDPTTLAGPSPQWSTSNPVGLGFVTSAAGAEGLALPNIEYPETLVTEWSDRPRPAGFGPIAAHWQPRLRLAGTYDHEWEEHRFPLLPEDFDDRHYQCAPTDQQPTEFLRGGEPVRLHNLTPGGELRFTIPKVFLGFETFFLTGERQIHDRPQLHTVAIEADVPRVSLVWHTALPCHPKVHKLDRTRIIEKRELSRAGAEVGAVARS
jgi:hypothetical protein